MYVESKTMSYVPKKQIKGDYTSKYLIFQQNKQNIDEMFTSVMVTDMDRKNKIIEQYSIFGGVYAVLQFVRWNRVYHKGRGYLVFNQRKISGAGCINSESKSNGRYL